MTAIVIGAACCLIADAIRPQRWRYIRKTWSEGTALKRQVEQKRKEMRRP